MFKAIFGSISSSGLACGTSQKSRGQERVCKGNTVCPFHLSNDKFSFIPYIYTDFGLYNDILINFMKTNWYPKDITVAKKFFVLRKGLTM